MQPVSCYRKAIGLVPTKRVRKMQLLSHPRRNTSQFEYKDHFSIYTQQCGHCLLFVLIFQTFNPTTSSILAPDCVPGCVTIQHTEKINSQGVHFLPVNVMALSGWGHILIIPYFFNYLAFFTSPVHLWLQTTESMAVCCLVPLVFPPDIS